MNASHSNRSSQSFDTQSAGRKPIDPMKIAVIEHLTGEPFKQTKVRIRYQISSAVPWLVLAFVGAAAALF